jgi:hypothetical protein
VNVPSEELTIRERLVRELRERGDDEGADWILEVCHKIMLISASWDIWWCDYSGD